MIATLFNELLYRPFLNLLIFLYQTVAFNDLGVAIVLLTIIVRFLLFPLFYKSLKNQTLLMKIQPHVKKIQEDHKNNREHQAKALMDLYKTHKVNPFTGIFLMLVQLPILIGLYQVFLHGFSDAGLLADVYPFITAPEHFNTFSFGLIDLQKRHILVTLLAAFAQYLQIRLAQSRKVVGDQGKNPMASANKVMVFVGPLITIWILSFLPSAIGVYWLTTTVFSGVQQLLVNKRIETDHGDMDTGKPKELRKGTS